MGEPISEGARVVQAKQQVPCEPKAAVAPLVVEPYEVADLPEMRAVWNEVVASGVAFPQEEPLSEEEAAEFFAAQTCTAVARDRGTGRVVGLYILHPNNVGRCGHIANASFAVASSERGRGAGELLVRDCIERGARAGFRVLQFNVVVETNAGAKRLYERLGFSSLGVVPGGFRLPSGAYEDIRLYYRELPGAPLPEARR